MRGLTCSHSRTVKPRFSGTVVLACLICNSCIQSFSVRRAQLLILQRLLVTSLCTLLSRFTFGILLRSTHTRAKQENNITPLCLVNDTMVTVEALPGIELTVNVANSPLEEIEDPEEPDQRNQVTHYIKSTAGETFEIVIKSARGCNFPGDAIQYDIFVDGIWAADPMVSRVFWSTGFTRISQGCLMPDALSVNKYRFADVDIGESIPFELNERC